MDALVDRLDRIRGTVAPRNHNARTIAALTTNPGCGRRGLMDAAGVNKGAVAGQLGFPAAFGQSRFAIARGNAFEAQVKADGAAELLQLLRERLGLAIPEVAYDDLSNVGGNASREVRYARTRSLLARAAAERDDAGTLFDHPMLRLDIAGYYAYLEPDLIAFRAGGRFHVVEIKSFAVIDGQADPGKAAAAAKQSAVYVLAMRELLGELGHPPESVSHNVVLVCPENFANRPTATLVDVRKQLTVLRRQLSRLTRLDKILDALPSGLSFDLAYDSDQNATRPADELRKAVSEIDARYSPDCLGSCEMAFFCRDEAAGSTTALGRSVRDDLGGVESVSTVLGLARGTLMPGAGQEEIAGLLRMAHRLRRECLDEAV
ncbi:hypothetical protein ACQP1P_39400 [Dactylosporangium sp. CA-052675]|uniref:hypothetical protein n=1 Tax=Dactylosporangium sp. CA-052675 TaxID=3239927 RepID=UPI003D93EF33